MGLADTLGAGMCSHSSIPFLFLSSLSFLFSPDAGGQTFTRTNILAESYFLSPRSYTFILPIHPSALPHPHRQDFCYLRSRTTSRALKMQKTIKVPKIVFWSTEFVSWSGTRGFASKDPKAGVRDRLPGLLLKILKLG